MEDLTQEEVADFFQTAVRVQRVMEKVQGVSSATLCVQDGKEAGQTVPVSLNFYYRAKIVIKR